MFLYPLDDTYIHLALARTLAFHHVWGINPSAFASASSAPGWTLVLTAVNLIAGAHLLTPLFLNAVFALAVVFMVCLIVRTSVPRAPAWSGFVIAAAVVGFSPVPAMWIMGMEHVAQMFAVLLLVWSGAGLISRQGAAHGLTTVCAAAALATSIRYEGVLAVAAVVLLLVVRRRFRAATLTALSGAIPMALFGLYFHARSGFFLPFSVVVKASYGMPGFAGLASALEGLNPITGALLPFLIFLVVARFVERRSWEQGTTYGLLVILIVSTHLLVSRSGWLLRYEAYAVTILLTAVGTMIAMYLWNAPSIGIAGVPSEVPRWPLWLVTVVALALSAKPMMLRFWSGEKLTALAAVDRLDEHMQMARFVTAYYDTSSLVLDDIGAVSYFSHAKILDMVGLGSIEPLLPTRDGRQFTASDMQAWAEREHAPIAILQPTPEGIRSRIPRSWTLVQTWKQPRNVVFGDLVTSLYATRKDDVEHLCESLADFKLIADDAIVYNACPSRMTPAPSSP